MNITRFQMLTTVQNISVFMRMYVFRKKVPTEITPQVHK